MSAFKTIRVDPSHYEATCPVNQAAMPVSSIDATNQQQSFGQGVSRLLVRHLDIAPYSAVW
jgi:hypothetical protein